MINFLKKLNIKELKSLIDKLTLYSAAMSFYTIFSLIPVLLLVLSIFSSTPYFKKFYDKLQNFLISNILPSNHTQIEHYINTFLTNSANMGIIGGIYILVTSILFFDNYETIISKIFEQEKRDLWSKIKLYWTMITMFPILFAIAIFISIKIEFYLKISFGFIIPFLIIWITFFLAYKLTLNTKTEKYPLLSSLFTTTAFFIAKNIFLYYIVLNKTYKSLYGSISILLFLFLWIYINWIIYFGGIYLIKFFEDKMLQNYTQKEN